MKQSKFSESQIIKALKENQFGRSVEEVSKDCRYQQRNLLQMAEEIWWFKQLKTGINDFKYTLAHMHLYKLENGELSTLSDFERDQRVMYESDIDHNQSMFKVDDGYYFISG